jgi:hypothetical protein
MLRSYNYPWSGKVGKVAPKCLWCGSKGSDFDLSSSATSCLGMECRNAKKNGAEPIPEFVEEYKAILEKAVRAWCVKHKIDYDQTIKELHDKHGGPPNQEF